jgi:hypothetical protein
MTLGAFSCAFAVALGEGGRPTPNHVADVSLVYVGWIFPAHALWGTVVGFGLAGLIQLGLHLGSLELLIGLAFPTNFAGFSTGEI